MNLEEIYQQAAAFVKDKFNLTPDRNDGRISILSIMKDMIDMSHNEILMEHNRITTLANEREKHE